MFFPIIYNDFPWEEGKTGGFFKVFESLVTEVLILILY